MASKGKIGIIGGGPSGIAFLQELTAAGYDCTLFEAKASCGGLYRGLYEGAMLTTSMYWITFTKFPPRLAGWREDKPVHWSCAEYADYCDAFVEHFGLGKYCHFHTKVEKCTYDSTREEWSVTTSGEAAGTYAFDRLVVASGIHRALTWDQLQQPGQANYGNFQGEMMHSSQYKNPKQFVGKRVLVIGAGETGADIAGFATQTAASVTVSVRSRMGHITPRTFGHSSATRENERGEAETQPLDLDHCLLVNCCPNPYVGFVARFRDAVPSVKQDDETYAMRMGSFNVLQGTWVTKQFGCKTTGVMQAIADGAAYKPGVKEVTATTVRFVDGSEEEFDTIVLCTGYRSYMPFLEETMASTVAPTSSLTCSCPCGAQKFNSRDLYLHMFNPDWGDKVVFPGFVRPAFGSIPQLSEMQAVYYTRLIQGEVAALPPKVEMVKFIKEEGNREIGEFYSAKTLFPLVSFGRYSSLMAKLSNSEVDYYKIFYDDWKLCIKLLVCQYTVQRFRLQDPDPAVRAVARETVENMMISPLAFYDLTLLIPPLFLSTLGFKSFRPYSFGPPPTRVKILAWGLLPLWATLLSPSFTVFGLTWTWAALHPLNLIRLYKVYVKGVPDGIIDWTWGVKLLTSPRFLAIGRWVGRPLLAVTVVPAAIISKLTSGLIMKMAGCRSLRKGGPGPASRHLILNTAPKQAYPFHGPMQETPSTSAAM